MSFFASVWSVAKIVEQVYNVLKGLRSFLDEAIRVKNHLFCRSRSESFVHSVKS